MVRRCSKNRYVAPRATTASAPGQDGEIAAVWIAKASRLKATGRGQSLLTVPEVVFEIVSVGFQHVERFVLDLPSGTSTGGEFGDGIGGDARSVTKLLW